MKKHLQGILLIAFYGILFTIAGTNIILGGSAVNREKDIVSGMSTLADNDLDITIEPIYDFSTNNFFHFKVTVSFKGDETGRTIIQFPDKFNGQSLDECITGIYPASQYSAFEETGTQGQKIIIYPAKSEVTFCYEVKDIRRTSYIDINSRYLPVISDRYFHFFGESFFALPLTNGNREYNIKLQWRNLPAGWFIANSFGTYRSYQEIKCSLSNFRQSVFIGGNDLHIITKYINQKTFYIAVRGEIRFSESTLADFLWSVLNETRAFWNDYNYDNYLVTVLATGDNYDFASQGRVNSFSLFLGSKKNLDYGLKKTIAREAFHNWLGGIISPDGPSQFVSWFIDGFGEYYSRLLLLRANQISIEDYISEYNDVLNEYGRSNYRYASSTQQESNSWSDPALIKLQFLRGDILAHNLNAAITNYSENQLSLDDFMHDIFSRARKEGLQISNGALSAMIRYFAGEKTLSEIMSTVNTGKPIKPRADALGKCATIKVSYPRRFLIFGEQFEIYSYLFDEVYFNRNREECMKWFIPNND